MLYESNANTNAFTDADEATLGRTQRRLFHTAYASDATATPSTVPDGAFLALDEHSAKIGNNSDWTADNLKYFVFSDVQSYWRGITDPNDVNFDRQFIETDGDISALLHDIEIGGIVVVQNQSGTRAVVCEIESISTSGGRMKLGVIAKSFIGTGQLTQGDNIVVQINPNNEIVLWSKVRGAPDFATKLAGIEAGAQVNPKHVVNFPIGRRVVGCSKRHFLFHQVRQHAVAIRRG